MINLLPRSRWGDACILKWDRSWARKTGKRRGGNKYVGRRRGGDTLKAQWCICAPSQAGTRPRAPYRAEVTSPASRFESGPPCNLNLEAKIVDDAQLKAALLDLVYDHIIWLDTEEDAQEIFDAVLDEIQADYQVSQHYAEGKYVVCLSPRI